MQQLDLVGGHDVLTGEQPFRSGLDAARGDALAAGFGRRPVANTGRERLRRVGRLDDEVADDHTLQFDSPAQTGAIRPTLLLARERGASFVLVVDAGYQPAAHRLVAV